jgi:uncharacterized membrane protein
MTKSANLWAVGFGTTGRAAEVRDEITKLAWEKHCLILRDVAVAVRYRDGSFTLNGEPFPPASRVAGGTIAHLLASLALGAPPLSGPAVDAMFATIGDSTPECGITKEFVKEVQGLIKPGTSVLFVLDQEGDMDAILFGIRGLGGTVLRTNVDREHAKLIQSTLVAQGETIDPE